MVAGWVVCRSAAVGMPVGTRALSRPHGRQAGWLGMLPSALSPANLYSTLTLLQPMYMAPEQFNGSRVDEKVRGLPVSCLLPPSARCAC